MPNDIPKAIADEDAELDALLTRLETGPPPAAPEVPAVKEEEVVKPAVSDTLVDVPLEATPAPQGEEFQKMQQKYSTLQGMMKAESNRTNQIIGDLQEQLKEQKQTQTEAPLDVSKILSEDELAQFGDDGVAVITKMAEAIAAREIARARQDVEGRLADLQNKVDQNASTATGNTLWDQIEQANPGAKAINDTDPGWFTFLDLTDSMSGRTYRELGEAAANVGDVNRLSQLIDAYRKHTGATKPPAPPVKPVQAPTVAPLNNDGERQPEQKVYKESEIRAFYDGITRGKSGLTAEQAQVEEDDIDAAIEEGRVQMGV